MTPRAVRVAAVTAGAFLALTVTAGPVSAHTTLRAAAPAIGATVAPPHKVVLTYADPVHFPQVVLTDAAGRRHESGKAQAVDDTVTEQVAGTLAPGVYTVGWRVVAVDGHPVSGEYHFTVKGGTGSAAAPGPMAGPVAASSGNGWWWIGLAVLLGAGLVAGVAFARRSLRS